MAKNIEVKAYCDDLAGARAVCGSIGAKLVRSNDQTDTYFRIAGGRLKLRQNSTSADELIFYSRLNSPELRDSTYDKTEIGAGADVVRSVLEKAVGVRTVVRKKRETFTWKTAIVNIDSVDGLGDFVEIEADVESSGGEDAAMRIAEELKRHLKIERVDILPFSYSDMIEMFRQAADWRAKLRAANNPGTLFLIDGASCSGKTTLAYDMLADKDLKLAFVPRYCTREKRDQATEDEYIFVSHGKFEELAAEGAFMEYRDFLFGMSYGTPWDLAVSPLLEGRSSLGVINLGNVRHVKRIFPEAVAILIHAPVETLRRRLVARGLNEEHQIEERLGNARTVEMYGRFYDFIVENEDGALDRAMSELRGIMAGEKRLL